MPGAMPRNCRNSAGCLLASSFLSASVRSGDETMLWTASAERAEEAVAVPAVLDGAVGGEEEADLQPSVTAKRATAAEQGCIRMGRMGRTFARNVRIFEGDAPCPREPC